jgi:hypothetical protein
LLKKQRYNKCYKYGVLFLLQAINYRCEQFNVLDIYFQREAEVDVVPEADAPAVSREEGRSCKRTS